MIISGSAEMPDTLVQLIISRFTLGTVKIEPGFITFFGLNITQREDHSISVDDDEKMMQLESFALSRVLWCQKVDLLKAIF